MSEINDFLESASYDYLKSKMIVSGSKFNSHRYYDIEVAEEALKKAYEEGRQDVLKLCKKFPNDLELGEKIRTLYDEAVS